LTVAKVPMVVGAILKALTNHQTDIKDNDYLTYATHIKQSYLAFVQDN